MTDEVNLADISRLHFGVRFQHFFVSTGDYDLAWNLAAQEMLDEQHAMLHAICDKLGIER